jgi:hypothetical protein
MDDKTLIAEYAANEMVRINERLKEMIGSETPPSEEYRQGVISDIEATLSRLQRALAAIDIEDFDKDETKQ